MSTSGAVSLQSSLPVVGSTFAVIPAPSAHVQSFVFSALCYEADAPECEVIPTHTRFLWLPRFFFFSPPSSCNSCANLILAPHCLYSYPFMLGLVSGVLCGAVFLNGRCCLFFCAEFMTIWWIFSYHGSI